MADNNEKDIFKNLILAGVGALAMTAEKISESITELQKVGKITADQGKEIIDELAKKGEITIEQGKKIVEQLKTADKETGAAENEFGTMNFESMDDEKLARLKEEIEKIENERKGNQE